VKGIISENICIIPFIHLGTKPDGVARVCCMAPSLEITQDSQKLSLPSTTIDQVWNSSYLRALRQRMLAGEKLKECSACWDQEVAGPHSKRLRENRKYLHANEHRLLEASRDAGKVSSPPIYFDLRLGNKCNLRCRTCNPIFSHSWLSELEGHGLNDFLPSTLPDIQGLVSRAAEMKPWYQEEFFNQLEPILPFLQEIYVSGGEPMIISELENFLILCARRNFAKNIELRLNSNVSVFKESFVSALSCFKKVSFGASIDAFGIKNDWLRAPSKWKNIIANLSALYIVAQSNSHWDLTVNITVSAYNALYVDELIVFLKENYPKLTFTFDFVARPTYMALDFLPPSLATQATLKLTQLEGLALSKHEKMYVSQLKGYLEGARNIEASTLLRQFYNHTEVVDQWRNENAKTIFPELFALLEGHSPPLKEVDY